MFDDEFSKAFVGWSLEEQSTLTILKIVTLAYRDELKEEGIVLTVASTRKALDVLEMILNSREVTVKLDKYEAELVRRWLDRLGYKPKGNRLDG